MENRQIEQPDPMEYPEDDSSDAAWFKAFQWLADKRKAEDERIAAARALELVGIDPSEVDNDG
jgi:hypothetical protein